MATISEKNINEKYLADDGPAHIEVTYVDNNVSNTQQIRLGGFVTLDVGGGIQQSDLQAAQSAFMEIMNMLKAKYPYV